jgi:Domain of unknown function (DUF4112)
MLFTVSILHPSLARTTGNRNIKQPGPLGFRQPNCRYASDSRRNHESRYPIVSSLRTLSLVVRKQNDRLRAGTVVPVSAIEEIAVATRYYDTFTGTQRHPSRRDSIERLDFIARLLDTAFVVPGTNIRFGVEAVIRLMPGIGDAVASALSCVILIEAHRLGVPTRILARMIANVLLEGTAGAMPVVGDMFDIMFRANRRNIRILHDYMRREGLI